MPSDAWPPTSLVPPQRSLETLKETFKQRLDGILNKQLTVENIQTFADTALIEAVRLTEDVLNEYQSNPKLNVSQITIDKKIREDEAFAFFGLPNINEILQSIIDVKDKIQALGRYINERNILADKVVIPPQPNSHSEIRSGSGQGIEEKKLIPRLLTLLYILETDFEIMKEQVKITAGKVTPEMMRKTPYVRVEIPDIGRIVYICDEEGNASYVFDVDKLEEIGITAENLDIEDKGSMSDLIAKHPGIGIRIIQTKHWRTHMAEVLENTIPKKVQEEKSERPASEFTKREKKEFLPFEEFLIEVKNLYPKIEENVSRWYDKEKINHKYWPSVPEKVYKDKGWVGYPELVGKENIFKKEFLDLDTLRLEVRALYPGIINIQDWYSDEYSKHLKWPSNPSEVYKNRGWVGYTELVGKENKIRKELLSFENFKAEVASFYNGESNIFAWYQKEKLNHPKWPSNPRREYQNKGWQGWPELVGKKKE